MLQNMTFTEKLQLIKDVYLENNSHSFSKDEIVNIENTLKLEIPEGLKEFYLIFGDNSELLKCMYDIALPQELYVKNDILIIAKENQNVCSYGINILTKKLVYFDNNVVEEINQDIEDFLIYLLALQGTEYLNCIGTIDVEFTAEIEKHLIKLTKAEEKAVFCDREAIICVVVGDDIFICAKDDDCMESFENKTGLEVDYL